MVLTMLLPPAVYSVSSLLPLLTWNLTRPHFYFFFDLLTCFDLGLGYVRLYVGNMSEHVYRLLRCRLTDTAFLLLQVLLYALVHNELAQVVIGCVFFSCYVHVMMYVD